MEKSSGTSVNARRLPRLLAQARTVLLPEALFARPIVAGIVDVATLRHAQGNTAHALPAKATLATPFAADIVEIRVRGNDDRIAAGVDAGEAAFALKIVAGTHQICVGGNRHRDARTVQFAKAALAVPTGAKTRVNRKGMRRNHRRHATVCDSAIAAIAAPAAIVPGVHSVAVGWNPHLLARGTLGAKAAIAGPRRAIGRQISIRRYGHSDATSGALAKAAVAIPSGAVAALARVIGNRGDRALRLCSDRR